MNNNKELHPIVPEVSDTFPSGLIKGSNICAQPKSEITMELLADNNRLEGFMSRCAICNL